MLPLSGSWTKSTDFLGTAIDLNAGLTATNGAEFNSRALSVKERETVAVTVTFTRAAGAADTVDFSFEASYDDGISWTTYRGVKIDIPTNQVAVKGTIVRVMVLVSTPGCSHLRLKTVVNNDGVNNLTDVNVTMSY